jgi:hypothetical protein
MIVETKRQAFALYHGGRFGNKLRTWDTVRDFVYSNYCGLVTMRYKGTITGKAWYAYNVKSSAVADKAKEWIAQGADPMLIVLNESAPDDRLILQGELIHTHRGYCLLRRFDKVKMRVAMTLSGEADEVVGITALATLRHACTGSSFDDPHGVVRTVSRQHHRVQRLCDVPGQLPGPEHDCLGSAQLLTCGIKEFCLPVRGCIQLSNDISRRIHQGVQAAGLGRRSDRTRHEVRVAQHASAARHGVERRGCGNGGAAHDPNARLGRPRHAQGTASSARPPGQTTRCKELIWTH